MNKKMAETGKLVAGLLIIVLLVYFAGIEKIAVSLASFNAILIIPVFMLFILALVFGAVNLKILLDAKLRMGFFEFFPDYCLSWIAGSLIPGKIGDFSLAYLMKDKTTVGVTTAIIMLDKIITLFVLTIAGSLSVTFFVGPEYGIYIICLLLFSWIIGFILLFSATGRNAIARIIPKKYSQEIQDFYFTLREFIDKEKMRISLNLAGTVLKLGTQSFAFMLIFLGFGINVKLLDMFLITSTATIFSFVPFTASGLGIKEGAFAFLWLQRGIMLEKSLANAAISTIMNYVLVAILMVLFINRQKAVAKKIQAV